MRMTFALAALFAATAITPALAQDNNGRGDRGGARAERGGGGQGGGWQRGGGDRPQGGWQRPQQVAPQATPAPQPQAQPQSEPGRQWNGNRGGDGRGGVAAQQNWNRGQQDGQRNWRRDDAPRGQMGGTPAAPPPAVVNRDPNQDGRRFDGNRQNRGGWSGTFGASNGQAWQQNQNRNDGWRDRPRDDGNRWNNGGRPDNRNWNNNNRAGNNGWNGNRNWNGNAWNRDWRRNQQYDWQRYRYSNRNLFRANPYYAPRGWGYGYQRFSIGIVLNSLLWDQQYWIDDPNDYRLPPAYGPYRWVRYYDDVLLVDIRNGQVVDVINDFFW